MIIDRNDWILNDPFDPVTATYTSLTSYRHHVLSGKATSQRNRILTCLFESAVPLTRLQISKITRIRLSSVCGRVNTLLKSGLVRVAYEAEDPETRHLAEYLETRWPHLEQKERVQRGVKSIKN